MNKSYLKKLNEKSPSFLKKIFKSVVRNKLIKNKNFIDKYNEINEFRKLSQQEKESIQFEKLKHKLIYAYENVDYYKSTFDKVEFNPYKIRNFDDIKVLPVINKETILNNFEKFISKEKIDFYEAYTGGSSGKSFKILLDNKSIFFERAFVYNFWSLVGYDYRKSKMVTFRGVEYKNGINKYNPLYNEMLLSPFKLNDENLGKYIKIIEEFSPEFICGYPSAINEFSRLLKMKENILRINIKAIFLISENVTENEKKMISELFNCPIVSFYGHSERAVFAETLDKYYDFNQLYGYTELEEVEEGKYRIICTGFLNNKMPLIRYATDDVVEIENSNFKITGHWDKELLIGKNGEKVSIASINFHSNEFYKIRRYQFVQDEIGKIKIYLEKDCELSTEDLCKIKNVIDKKIRSILDYELIVTDEIKLTNRGKFKKIIQNVKYNF